MLRRCYNTEDKDYQRYGGRGLAVCELWRCSPIQFVRWAKANGWKKGLRLDRTNNNLSYSPANCRWTTQSVQVRNTKRLAKDNTSGYRGVTFSRGRWVAGIGVNGKRVYLGAFKTSEAAGRAYDRYVSEHDLEHTRNFA